MIIRKLFKALAVCFLISASCLQAEAAAPSEENPVIISERIQQILHEEDAHNGHPAEEAAAEVHPEEGNDIPSDARSNPAVILPSAGKYSFDWQGTPIASSLYAIAKISHKDIVINGDLNGKVYMSLHNVTPEYAMDLLAKSFEFNWMIDDNAIVISTDDKMYQSRSFAVQYIDKSNLAKELKALGIDEDKIYANDETGSISVTGTPYQIREAEKRIAALDHPVSQCLILAQMFEIDHGSKLDLGMSYTMPTYIHPANLDPGADTMSGSVIEKLTFAVSGEANKALSKGKVIARPMIMILNGQEGSVDFGDKIPVKQTTSSTTATNVTYDYKDVGNKLKVTPIINERTGDIKMKVNIEISAISKWVIHGDSMAPQISSRSAQTSAHLKSGESFVIGGLMSVNEIDNLAGIPGLMDLPVLGKLFSYHSKSKTYAEVYIMITPYIVDGNTDPRALLKKVDD